MTNDFALAALAGLHGGNKGPDTSEWNAQVRLTERDKLHLAYLAKAGHPLWGGHLQRGEPITDPDMQRWLDLGLIERVSNQGYLATARCKAALQQTPGA